MGLKGLRGKEVWIEGVREEVEIRGRIWGMMMMFT
jgi:hypothetical protein